VGPVLEANAILFENQLCIKMAVSGEPKKNGHYFEFQRHANTRGRVLEVLQHEQHQ
jgi:hypothetical protein